MYGDMVPDVPRAKQQIRELLEHWVIWRDGAEWDRLQSVWHDDGIMVATWFQASAADFVARSRKAVSEGLKVYHTLGASVVDVVGRRAVARTKMEIMQRASVHGVLVDVTCRGRFMDTFEERTGRWGLVERRLAYEFDRMDPVDPAASLALEPALLSSFPEGYRHLAYLQTQAGFAVHKDLPGRDGPELAALNKRLSHWLAAEEGEMA